MVTSNFQEVNVDDVEVATSLKTSEDSKTKLKIALVGETGSGKSTFINAIRGLEEDDEGAAGTGFEKTIEAKPYPHPLNSDVILWDLPGLDTLKHSDPSTYFSTFPLGQYHAVLLFIKGNYTKTDKDLAKELHSRNKPFFLVRTKVDNDLPRSKNKNKENEMLEKIRENALEILADLSDGDSEKKLFLINNSDPEKWDFERLKKAILSELLSSGVKTTPLSEKVAKHIDEQINGPDKETLLRNFRKNLEDFAHEVKEKGLQAAKKKMEKALEEWKEKQIKLAVIGNSGAGKSSFINAIRGLHNDHPDAAKTGAKETTMDGTPYSYPDNPLITLWDLPGIGSKNYPDFKAYCKKIKLKEFDEFVIITTTRFTANDVKLAKKLKSMNKPFFFLRTKIDIDCQNEGKKASFVEEKLLEEIKENCSDNLKGLLLGGDSDIYLISNFHPSKWDFPRLVEAILNKLSLNKQVCFVFSMYIVSESILKEKVKRLRGRIWKVALFSILKKIGPKEKSHTYDLSVVQEKVQFYLLQLGFPKEDSKQFKTMSEELQKEVREFYLTSEVSLESWLKKFDTDGENAALISWLDENKAIEELPWLKNTKGIVRPFGFVYCSLNRVLDAMSKVSLKILREKIGNQLF